jgi:hypothetical protein
VANPYEIAIHISMQNTVSPVLAMIAKDMLGLNMSVEKLDKAFERVGGNLKMLIGGATAMAGGFEIGKGLLDIAEHGKELTHQQNMLVRNGIEYNKVLGLTKDAFDSIAKAVPTASVIDILRATNELVSVKGTLAGAEKIVPDSLKMEAVIGNATGKSAERQGYDIWRSIEDKGIIQNKAETDFWKDLIVKGINATGAKVGGSDIYAYGRKAMSSWVTDSPESFPLALMEMQTLTPQTAGVMRRMFSRMVEGGQKLTKKQLAAWGDVGMLDPKGNILDRDVESTHPEKFIPMLMDNLEKHGIKGLEATKLWAQRALNASSSEYFLTAYAGMTEKDADGKTRLDKETENIRRALGMDSYEAMMGRPDRVRSPQDAIDASGAPGAAERAKAKAAEQADYGAVYGAVMLSLQKQWDGLLAAVGGPVAKAAIPKIQALTDALTSMSKWANDNKGATAMIADAAAVSSAVLMIGGAVAVTRGVLGVLGVTSLAKTLMGFGGDGGAAAAAATGGAASAAPAAAASGFLARLLGSPIGSFGAAMSLIIGDASGNTAVQDLIKKRTSGDLDYLKSKPGIVTAFDLDPTTRFHIDSQVRAGFDWWSRDRHYAESSLSNAGYRGNDKDLELGREASRGRALGAPQTPPPAPVLNLTQTITGVPVTLTLDGRVLSSMVMGLIVKGNQTVKGSSSFDGRSMPTPAGQTPRGSS